MFLMVMAYDLKSGGERGLEAGNDAARYPKILSGISGGGAFVQSAHPVVRSFLGDTDIVYVALAHAGSRDPHELRFGAHLRNILAAGVTHAGAQSTHHLVHDG